MEKSGSAAEKSISNLKTEVETLKKQLTSQKNDINKQERFSRRNNFRVVGILRSQNENCTELIAEILKSKFGWESRPCIERAHRDGRESPDGRPPHVLVKLLSYQDKIKIMKDHRKALLGSYIFIVDDLTTQDLKEKMKWKTQVKSLYDTGVKLRFYAGYWRSGNGQLFTFTNDSI